MSIANNTTNELLFVGFNQDNGCFACGTDTGFVIYNCDPFKETFRRTFSNGGIGCVEMLFRCNILALVGGGRNPRYPPNRVMIWDDHQSRSIGELCYRSDVKAVRLRRDKIVVVLGYKIYVYNFADLKIIDSIDTANNDKGLCAFSPDPNSTVLACPGTQVGHVRLELYDQKKTTLVPAHETALSCLALSYDGSRLATASEKGTLIRVFDTYSGRLLQELRRGADRAEIYSISFSRNNEWLAVSSDKGTVHVFKLDAAQMQQDEAGGKKANPTSSFSFLSSLLPKYFSSQWSFSQFRVPEVRSIVAFGSEPNSIVVVCANGAFYKALFDPEKPGAECTQESFVEFVRGPDEE
jgi:WD40 repeat protein